MHKASPPGISSELQDVIDARFVIYGVNALAMGRIFRVINSLTIDNRNCLQPPECSNPEPIEQPARSRLRRDRQKRREIGGAVDVEPNPRQLDDAWL